MGKWLDKFLADTPELRHDIPDTVLSVSALSGRDVDVSTDITSKSASDGPTAPLQPGWLVVFRDAQGILRGGSDERGRGTVVEMAYHATGWNVILADGATIPLGAVLCVARTTKDGRILAAWRVREHGFDGTSG